MPAHSPYRGLACGDCSRVYPFPKDENGREVRKPKPEEVCPCCDSVLRITMRSPDVTAQETFDLWEAHRVTELEGMLDSAATA